MVYSSKKGTPLVYVRATKDVPVLTVENYLVYFSKRGIPLVYVGLSKNVPVLTVENYSKWYGFCLVLPDGSVEEVDFGVLLPSADEKGLIPYVDHVPNALLVPGMAESRGWVLDDCSYEMMVGRWESEVASPEKYDY